MGSCTERIHVYVLCCEEVLRVQFLSCKCGQLYEEITTICAVWLASSPGTLSLVSVGFCTERIHVYVLCGVQFLSCKCGQFYGGNTGK